MIRSTHLASRLTMSLALDRSPSLSPSLSPSSNPSLSLWPNPNQDEFFHHHNWVSDNGWKMLFFEYGFQVSKYARR